MAQGDVAIVTNLVEKALRGRKPYERGANLRKDKLADLETVKKTLKAGLKYKLGCSTLIFEC